MDTPLHEDHAALRQSARRVLEARATTAHARAAMATERGWDPATWAFLARELGWAALTAPERHGGAGLGHQALATVMEETGRALLCAPFFATVALAVNALLALATEAQKDAYLPPLAAGEATATLAPGDGGDPRDPSSCAVTATPGPDGYLLTGRARYVVDGHTADLVLVAARAPAGIGLFAVDGTAAGLTRRALPTMDRTRRLAELRFDAVALPPAARLGGDGLAPDALARALDLSCVALAAEQLGGAQRCLDMAVEHARTRVQFNRPIGSFQAVKHACAELFVAVECARSACYHAARVADHDPQALPAAASMARATCSDAYFRCAAENIQIHGGVGFTWEHDAHLYFKRAHASGLLLGTAGQHRERLARLLGL